METVCGLREFQDAGGPAGQQLTGLLKFHFMEKYQDRAAAFYRLFKQSGSVIPVAHRKDHDIRWEYPC
ncbi:hypothetical protein A6E92_08815 [Streptomyces sp. S8]|nr:hypothetical protein A6E92_08815 [Streptomyces sp. S8]